MTLIAIILALIVGRALDDGGKLLSMRWFEVLINRLEKQFSAYRLWDSHGGILISVGIPLIVLALVLHLLDGVFFLLPFLVSVLILYLCLGFELFDNHIDNYRQALEQDNTGAVQDAAADILAADISRRGSDDFPGVLGSLFRQSNDRIFAVLFWFLVLGPLGALLYRLVYEVLQLRHDIHGAFTDSARQLYYILNWPCLRLTILAYALVGSLIHTIDVWRDQDDLSLAQDDNLLPAAGMAAIACGDMDDGEDTESRLYCIEHVDGLVKRSLLLWLTLIALSTISGWLA